MRLTEMTKGYTGWVLTDLTRDTLLRKFPPKYEKVIAHHITDQFGVTEKKTPEEVSATVVGYRDSFDGLECLVVEIDGSTKRGDGSTYHITWSLDPNVYKPKDSNELLQSGFKPVKSSIIMVDPFFEPFNKG